MDLHSKEFPTAAVVNVALVMGIFILDVMTPLGVPAWMLYFVPFFFMPENVSRYYPIGLAGLCTLLIFIGYMLSPPGASEHVSGRGIVLIVLWVYAVVLTRHPSEG
jgi:hypothetical protein